MSVLAQVVAYIVSPLATLLAVWVAYLALLRHSQPQILVYYRPNPDVQTLIDLVIENIGGATATQVKFSTPLPVGCFGIEKADGDGKAISELPAISAGQRYVYDGGQYAGLASKVAKNLQTEFRYKYRNPFGFTRERCERFVLTLTHLKYMPTRTSAQQAIVDALKGPNKTTVQEIRDELRALNRSLQVLVQRHGPEDNNPDA